MKAFKRTILGIISSILLATAAFPSVAMATETEAPSETELTEDEKTAVDAKNGMINTDDFVITVKCGIEGTYRYGAAVPIRINIESLTEEFEGKVRIIVPGNSDYGSEAVAYEKDILLSPGTPKDISLSVYNKANISLLYLQILNNKDKIIIDQSVKMAGKSGENALVGILSDDYTALSYLDQASVNSTNYTGRTSLVQLNESYITDEMTGFEALSYIVINSYDTSRLTEQQIQAIEKWVKSGGCLILGLGSDYQKTLSAIPEDFVSGEIKGNIEKSVKVTESTDELTFTEKDGLLDLEVKDAYSLYSVMGEDKLIWDHSYGKGRVMLTAFNLGMEPVTSWNGAKPFANLLFSAGAEDYCGTRIGNINYGSNDYSWNTQSALQSLRQIKEINAVVVVIELLLFAALIFISYFVLKGMDKREWIWAVIPSLSVIFTILVFATNAGVRIKNPVTTAITVIYDADEEGESSKTTYMSYLVPSVKKTELELNKNINSLNMMSEDSYYDGITNNKYSNKDFTTAIRETADGYKLTFTNSSTFETKYSSFSYVEDEGEKSAIDGFDIDITRTVKGISGTITNNTGKDLKGAGIFIADKRVLIGDLAAGESYSFTEKDNLANTMDYMYDIDVPGEFSNGLSKACVSSILYMAYQTYMANDLDYGGDRNSVFLFAVAENEEADFVNDEAISETNALCYVKEFSLGYSDYDGANMYTMSSLALTTDVWDPNDGQLYKTTGEIFIDLAGDNINKVFAIIRAKDNEGRYGDTSKTKLYIWNYDVGGYEELFVDDNIMKFDDFSPYLDDDGKMLVQFTCPTEYECYAPAVTIVGGEE